MTKDKLPISVFIIAQDEADRIDKPIISTRDWVDEIIVIDSGSKDNTIPLSKELGATTLYNEWNGYGAQKIFGEKQCKNEWLLNLDADEEITQEMADSIKELFKNGEPKHSAYKLRRVLLFKHEDKPPPLAPGDKPIRLYRKDSAGFKDSTVHDSVVVNKGTIGMAKGVILHRCFRDLEHWCKKINFYSSMQAKDFIKNGRKPSNIRILFEPLLSFLKAYILRRYFLYGIDGFIGSFLYAYARMLRMSKARELMLDKKYNN